jgi:AcrR family transcriptional regulator
MSVVAAMTSPIAPARDGDTRHTKADRRDSLLDAAADMVASGDVETVSMESVAVAAGVSRALVYKHFANRHDLLSSLYERESNLLHGQLAADVGEALDLEGMLRALVHGALAAQASRGATLAALNAGGGRPSTQRDLQRRRDRRTLRHFTSQAVAECHVDSDDARAGLALSLGAIPTVLARWRLRPTPENAAHLEDAFVTMAIGGMKEMARCRR